jgi:hypothetical protein
LAHWHMTLEKPAEAGGCLARRRRRRRRRCSRFARHTRMHARLTKPPFALRYSSFNPTSCCPQWQHQASALELRWLSSGSPRSLCSLQGWEAESGRPLSGIQGSRLRPCLICSDIRWTSCLEANCPPPLYGGMCRFPRFVIMITYFT